MIFIKVTKLGCPENTTAYVKPENIICVYEDSPRTCIELSNGNYLMVKETVEEIKSLIEKCGINEKIFTES